MFVVRNPIWAKIQDRKFIIHSMIESFPCMKKAYEEKVSAKIEQIAQCVSEGDKEIENSIRDQLQNSFYDIQDYGNQFLQAMLIMVYSYYESCANLIKNDFCYNNDINTKCDVVTFICNAHNVILSNDIKKDKAFLYEQVRELRNFLAHNNTTEPRSKEQLEKIELIIKEYPEIKYEDNEIIIINKRCIIDFLEKEYRVLKHICQAIGLCNK